MLREVKGNMYFDFQQQKEKYLNDIVFNRLVDSFYNLLINNEVTRFELESALDFANKKLAMEYPELMADYDER